jgi:hypothetical protein
MKCKYCGIKGLNWIYGTVGWYMAEPEGGLHTCTGTKYLDQEMVTAIQASVTDSDKWKANKFIKRLAFYRYLYPRARISPYSFIYGTDTERSYLCQCSDKAFQSIMKTGKTGILTKANHAQM